MATYQGSQCKTGSCGGHKAGASYARRGGRTLTRSSSSFNNGMRIIQRRLKSGGKRTRMSITKKSK
tara:strand:+ start:5909 stop:6106 length:198 start_codon:yes stop_codon:yes gene_type:complete